MKIFNWMMRTTFLIVSLSFLQCACAETSGKETPQAFVQAFYSWYAPVALKERSLPAVDMTIKEKANLFNKELYSALSDDSDARKMHRGSIVGLDFDPFLATQDPCDKYEVGNVIAEGDELKIEVYAVCDGKKRSSPDVEVALTKKDSQWVFSNFYYPPYGDAGNNLLLTLQQLKQTRDKNRKP